MRPHADTQTSKRPSHSRAWLDVQGPVGTHRRDATGVFLWVTGVQVKKGFLEEAASQPELI